MYIGTRDAITSYFVIEIKLRGHIYSFSYSARSTYYASNTVGVGNLKNHFKKLGI